MDKKAQRTAVGKWLRKRLKELGRLDDGWQVVHTTPNGSVLYALVDDGKVRAAALGGKALRKYLARRVSSTGIHVPITGPGTAEQPDTGGGPSEGQCAQRLWECTFGARADLWDILWGTIKNAPRFATLDILNMLTVPTDDARAKLKRCVGDQCARILGID